MTQKPALNDLLQKSDDELLLELGLCLLNRDERSLSGEPDADNVRQRARNWIDRHWAELQQVVRNSPAVDALRSDNALLAATLADFIANLWITEPGAFLVAAIVVKRGFDALCSTDKPTWDK